MRLWVVVVATGAALAASGCSRDVSAVRQMTRAADPSVKVPVAGYQSVTGGNVHYMPVGPKSWEELNRRVGPKS